MVEFAIILPLLVLLLFGIIEFGLLLYNKQVITNASREGARYGVVVRNPRIPANGTDSITSTANDYCKDYLVTFGADKDPSIVVDPNPTFGANFNDDLTVTVSYDYEFLVIPMAKIPLSEQTVMKYE